MNSQFVIAVIGKSGSGKNLVAQILTTRGFYPIDVDVVGHQQLEQHKEEVYQIFPGLSQKETAFDRQELAQLVFSAAANLKKLEDLLHPYIRKRTEGLLRQHPRSVIQGAVLEKIGLLRQCQLIIWIDTPAWVRLWRVKKRDHQRSWLEILRRFVRQKHLKPARSNHAKVIHIKNGFFTSQKTLAASLDELLKIGYHGEETRRILW